MCTFRDPDLVFGHLATLKREWASAIQYQALLTITITITNALFVCPLIVSTAAS
jgi:hypothetical protein